jgi:glycosyltransferase involved in cell wall biosynthesis
MMANSTCRAKASHGIKLLYYSSYSFEAPAGVTTWLKCLAERMPEHEITVVCPASSRVRKLVSLPSNVRIMRIPNLNKLGYGFVPSIQGLKEVLRLAHDSDVLLAEMCIAFNDLVSYTVARLVRKPIIYVLHCPLFLPYSRAHNIYTTAVSLALLRRSNAIWVMNSDEEKYLKRLGFQRVYRIPYGVDVEKFRPVEKTEREKFVVTFLARLTWQKGADVLVEAIKHLSKSRELRGEMLFRIAGYGEGAYEILRLSKASKGFVEYLGALPHELAPNLLARSDLFVLPSRYETFGIPALEAQSCGVPMIATNIPGLRDVVIHMKTGLLISPNSASELAKSILWFYELWRNEPDEYENFCLNARKNALNYDWKMIASMVNALLHEVLEEGIRATNTSTKKRA